MHLALDEVIPGLYICSVQNKHGASKSLQSARLDFGVRRPRQMVRLHFWELQSMAVLHRQDFVLGADLRQESSNILDVCEGTFSPQLLYKRDMHKLNPCITRMESSQCLRYKQDIVQRKCGWRMISLGRFGYLSNPSRPSESQITGHQRSHEQVITLLLEARACAEPKAVRP